MSKIDHDAIVDNPSIVEDMADALVACVDELRLHKKMARQTGDQDLLDALTKAEGVLDSVPTVEEFGCPHDWLLQHLDDLGTDDLWNELYVLVHKLDHDTIQDLYEREMEQDSYFV